MTPREKWQRIHAPTCPEDYGLSMTGAEMRTFPEGRRALARSLLASRERINAMRKRRISQPLARIARKMAKDIDHLILAALRHAP